MTRFSGTRNVGIVFDPDPDPDPDFDLFASLNWLLMHNVCCRAIFLTFG